VYVLKRLVVSAKLKGAGPFNFDISNVLWPLHALQVEK